MTSRFRKKYRDLTQAEMEQSKDIKNAAEVLEEYIDKARAREGPGHDQARGGGNVGD